jgi:hypothetical protein
MRPRLALGPRPLQPLGSMGAAALRAQLGKSFRQDRGTTAARAALTNTVLARAGPARTVTNVTVALSGALLGLIVLISHRHSAIFCRCLPRACCPHL